MQLGALFYEIRKLEVTYRQRKKLLLLTIYSQVRNTGRNGKAPLRIGRQVGRQWKSTLLVIFTSTPGQLIKTSWASCQFDAIK